MASAGMIVVKMAANRIATSRIGAQEYSFSCRMRAEVVNQEPASIASRTASRTRFCTCWRTPRMITSPPDQTPDRITAPSTPPRRRRLCQPSTASGSREPPHGPREPLAVEGWHNLLLLGGVLGAVIVSGIWSGGDVVILGVRQQVQNLVRDAVLATMMAASWLTTSARIREQNEFSWGPIREVAILFAAIFTTIIPALAMLRVGERGAMAFVVRAVREPAHFFWASGILSSFLDNAPTYLTFLSTALGRLYPGVTEREAIHRLIAENHAFLQAIATGSVFMGANTYIGNAPNFMVSRS